jgi:CysZ protein
MIKNILQGIKAYRGTFNLISKLKLWKFFFIPIIISIITASTIIFFAYEFSDNIGIFIAKIWSWEFGKDTFTSISKFVGGLVIIAVGFMLYKHIVMALSAPFMSPVSEKIEKHLLGIEKHEHRTTTFSQQLWRGIRINVRNLGMELVLSIPILLVSFIPVIGVLSSVLLFLVQAYYAGFGNMDYTLERHLTYRESLSFVKKNRGAAIGNGLLFMLFLLIPVIGIIIVLPLSVTAASLRTVTLLKDEDKLISLKTQSS